MPVSPPIPDHRTAARVSSHYEWGRIRRARAAAKSSAGHWGSSTGGSTPGGATPTAAWTAKDDATILASLDALRVRRAEAAIAAAELAKRGVGAGGAGVGGGGADEEEDDDDVEVS